MVQTLSYLAAGYSPSDWERRAGNARDNEDSRERIRDETGGKARRAHREGALEDTVANPGSAVREESSRFQAWTRNPTAGRSRLPSPSLPPPGPPLLPPRLRYPMVVWEGEA